MTLVIKFKQFILFTVSSYFFSATAFAIDVHVSAPEQGAVSGAASKIQESGVEQGATPQGYQPMGVQAQPPEAPTVYGITFPVVLVSDNPPNTHTYRYVVWYHPQKWTWGPNGRVNLFIAGSFGHWWCSNQPPYRALNIYAVVPVVRFYFAKMRYFSPYIEASVGPAYLTRTQFGNRNLGMHYSFEDELGIGAVAGKESGFYASLSVVHLSNGALSAHNSGITVPVMLNVGYQFN